MCRNPYLLCLALVVGCSPAGADAPASPAASFEPAQTTAPAVVSAPSARAQAEPAAATTSAAGLAPWESLSDPCMVGFAEGLAAQRAQRGKEERSWRVPGLGVGLRATLPSTHFVLSAVDPALVGFASASFDCGLTAVKVAKVGSLYQGDLESVRRKADLFGATKTADSELTDGFVVLAEGKSQGAEFMVFVVRKIGGREIYCEGTSRSAAGRDAMRTACESLRAEP